MCLLKSNREDCSPWNSPDILALCDTNVDDSIDSGSFLVSNYLLLIRKDSITHNAWSCSLCERRTSFYMERISRKLGGFLLMLALLYSVSYFFFLYQSPLLLCMVFDSVSSNIDQVLFINPSATVFVFGDFAIHHTCWLPYSGGTDKLVKSVIIFLSQTTLLR